MEEGQRLKVIYGSVSGFHAIDVDSGTPYDLYLPTHVRIHILSFGVSTFGIFFGISCPAAAQTDDDDDYFILIRQCTSHKQNIHF